MDKWTTLMEDTHQLQRALHILQVMSGIPTLWDRASCQFSICVEVTLMSVSFCDIEQPQHSIQLHPSKEPPSKADPVSEKREDSVKSHNF